MAHYPDGFTWGVATAAYQVEGAPSEDGRGVSSWDTFAATPGRVKDGSLDGRQVDQYHRYPEDIRLMQQLGVDAYRFSISWPRVQPDGAGALNRAGLDYYERLIEALLEAGIAPTPTMFHWDTPQSLEDAGGWLNRATAQRFADYCALFADRFADRVPRWMTVNEPAILMLLGYGLGVHAPGQQHVLGALPAGHHLLLGHGLAIEAMRSAGAEQIGIALSHSPIRAASDDADDRAAADVCDELTNRMFSDALLRGSYPSFVAGRLDVPAHDLEAISAPLDWYGVNYYNPTRVGAPGKRRAERLDGPPPQAKLPYEALPIDGVPHTAFGWPVVPDGLHELLTGLHARYGRALPPVFITENGCSTHDVPDQSGAIEDSERVAYLDGHLAALRRAIADGVDVRGYFGWSLIDNFEWAEGYTQRFGLVGLDLQTGRRTPKASYHWLREHLRSSRD